MNGDLSNHTFGVASMSLNPEDIDPEEVSGTPIVHNSTERAVDEYLSVSLYDIDNEGDHFEEQDMSDLESSELLPKDKCTNASNREYFCALLRVVQQQLQLCSEQINNNDTTSDIYNKLVLLIEKEKMLIEKKRCYIILNPKLMNEHSIPKSLSSSSRTQDAQMVVSRSSRNSPSQTRGGGWIGRKQERISSLENKTTKSQTKSLRKPIPTRPYNWRRNSKRQRESVSPEPPGFTNNCRRRII